MNATQFATEVKQRERSLYRIAITYLRQEQDALDAVQDALVISWEKRHTLRQPAYFGTWLTRILINCCKQKLRARKPETPLYEADAPSVPDSAEDLALKMAIETLDLKYRVPLLLYHLDGYAIKEVAAILRLPQGTVKSRLARARLMLKQELQEEEEVVYAQH